METNAFGKINGSVSVQGHCNLLIFFSDFHNLTGLIMTCWLLAPQSFKHILLFVRKDHSSYPPSAVVVQNEI